MRALDGIASGAVNGKICRAFGRRDATFSPSLAKTNRLTEIPALLNRGKVFVRLLEWLRSVRALGKN